MTTTFGTPKAARFGRTVRQEIRLMEQEDKEDLEEMNSFWDYEYGDDDPLNYREELALVYQEESCSPSDYYDYYLD